MLGLLALLGLLAYRAANIPGSRCFDSASGVGRAGIVVAIVIDVAAVIVIIIAIVIVIVIVIVVVIVMVIVNAIVPD